MNPEDVLRYLRLRAFEPFRMILTDGTQYEIRHPEMVLPARRTAQIGIPADPAQPIADRIVTISLLHLIRMESMEVATTK